MGQHVTTFKNKTEVMMKILKHKLDNQQTPIVENQRLTEIG